MALAEIAVAVLARPADDFVYDAEGHVRYDLAWTNALFLSGIERLERGAAEHRIVLLCGEEDPISFRRRRRGGSVPHSEVGPGSTWVPGPYLACSRPDQGQV